MLRLRTSCSARLPRADRARRAREDRARDARAVRLVLDHPDELPAGVRGRAAADRVIDYLAGHDRPLRASGPGPSAPCRRVSARLMARYTDDSRERVRDAVDFVELVGARTELKPAGPRAADRAVPVPRGAHAVVRHRPGREALPLLRLRRGRRRLQVRDGDRGARLRRRARGARRPRGGRARARGGGPARGRRSGARERLLALLERTAAYYVRVLWESDEAAHAREYLAERGLEEDVLREFRVGYSPRAWDRVIGASRAPATPGRAAGGRARGPAPRRRGLSTGSARGSFPVGRRAGARARVRRPRARPDDQPKYLNTSEGALFHKGRWSTAPTSRARRRRGPGASCSSRATRT